MTCQLYSKKRIAQLTELVKTSDLPMPFRVRKLAENGVKNSIFTGTAYMDYIQPYKGTLLQRLFMVKKEVRNKVEFRVAEYGRRVLGGDYVICNVYFSYMQGNEIWSENSDTSKTGWNSDECYIEKTAKAKRSFIFSPFIHVDGNKAIEKYGRYTGAREYFGNYEDHIFRYDLMDYLNIYYKHPFIEGLVKMGYGHFLSAVNLINGKGKNFSEVFGISPEWKNELKNPSYSRNDLILLRKYPWIKTAKEFKRVQELLSWYDKNGQNKYSCFGDQHVFETEEWEYVMKNLDYSESNIYRDYLTAAYSLGWDHNDNFIQFPKNKKELMKLHDAATSAQQVEKNRKYDKEILKYSEEAEKYRFSDECFTIFPVKNSEEMITESDRLHHCVKTYIPRVAAGETMIFFIRRTENLNDPYITLEADLKSGKVIQVRGKRNTAPDDKVKNFVNEWEHEFHLCG